MAYRFIPPEDSDSEAEEQRINEALRRPSLRTIEQRLGRAREIQEQRRLQRNPRPQTQEQASRSPTPENLTDETQKTTWPTPRMQAQC